MVSLDDLLDAGDARADARDAAEELRDAARTGVYRAVWLLAKTVRLLITVVVGVFYAAGWLAGRVVWPTLRFAGDAAMVGWRDGFKPTTSRSGPWPRS